MSSTGQKIAVLHTPLWNIGPLATRSLYLHRLQASLRNETSEPASPETASLHSNTSDEPLENQWEGWKAMLIEYLAATDDERTFLRRSVGQQTRDAKVENHSPSKRCCNNASQRRSKTPSKEEVRELEEWAWRLHDRMYWSV